MLVQVGSEEGLERLTEPVLGRRQLLKQLAPDREVEVGLIERDRKRLDGHRADGLAEGLVGHLDLGRPGEPAGPAQAGEVERLGIGVREGRVGDRAVGENDEPRAIVPEQDVVVEREERGDILERREGGDCETDPGR